MAAKKVRKKYNANKRYDKCADVLCRDILIVYTGSQNKEMFGFNRNTGKRIYVLDPTIFKSMFTANFNWVYQLNVFCRTQQGEEYTALMEVGSPHPCLHSQLLNSLNVYHKELISKCNPLHILNIGYVASIGKESVDPEIVNKIYEQLNVYDALSPWEVENRNPLNG